MAAISGTNRSIIQWALQHSHDCYMQGQIQLSKAVEFQQKKKIMIEL